MRDREKRRIVLIATPVTVTVWIVASDAVLWYHNAAGVVRERHTYSAWCVSYKNSQGSAANSGDWMRSLICIASL